MAMFDDRVGYLVATTARHQVLEHLLLESQQLAVQDLPKQGRMETPETPM